ncbi:hypothetical protein TRFO_20067 [Tritrichomonas foetus]|uniref:Uncharacterized protein n=1 Tax=Tritrichomonas foetus TaxID=1144522 RepID=A0A1J4KLK7_9EUKA|nr:hypothetical protein TRFO_20067 [Tritrichomonas foetus]|eukprot:OHT10574.1 hypothetical protein TRFO_20067 [Tritrichomonas foetus]
MSSGVYTTNELSSFDSSRNPSTELVQMMPKAKSNIVQYKRHTKISMKIIYLISFILVVISLFYPWFLIRSNALESFEQLIDSGLPIRAARLAQIVGTILDQYKMTTNYLSSLYESPQLLDTNYSNILQFVKFAVSTHATYDMKPSSMFIYTENVSFFMVNFRDDSSNYDFYSSVHIDGKYINKKFPSNYDFLNFDPINDGTTVQKIPSPTSPIPLDGRRWANSIFSDNGEYTTVLYSLAPTDGNRTIGMSMQIEKLYKIFDSGTVRKNLRYICMGLDGGVLFQSGIGSVKPVIVDGEPQFPKMADLGSEFWAYVSKIDFKTNIQQLIIFEETEYVARFANITSENQVTHHFILIVEKSKILSKPFFYSAVYIVVLISLLMILFVVAQFCKKRNDEKCKSRLSRQDTQFLPDNEGIESCSTLQHCITQLRSIELLYPEEIILNQVLDKVVANLCEQRHRHFLQKVRPNCGFCNHLISEPISTDFKTDTCFNCWSSMVRHLVDKDTPLVFNSDLCEQNPSQYLMKCFTKIILKENLTFEMIDPDIFLQFIFHFSISLCSDCTMASFVLCDVYNTLTTFFSTWIKNRIDFLIIYFTSMIYFTDSVSIEENLEMDEQTRIQIEALCDNYSRFTRKTEFVLDVFAEYFPGIEDQEIFKYFRKTVSKILLNIQDFNLLDMLGEFRVRIESPDFSVFNDDSDKILFFSALIKFCQFGIYFQDEDTMRTLAEVMDRTIFTPEEIRDRLLVSEFHYEHASKLAYFWLKCFTQFTEMPEKSENLEKTIRHWEGMKSLAMDEEQE